MQNLNALVLASTSRYRADLLRRLEVNFRTVAPAYDERSDDHRLPELGPAAFATYLAAQKAKAARSLCQPHEWILAADQIAVLGGPHGPYTLLHKPESEERAIEQLLTLAGERHDLVTGVVLQRADGSNHVQATDHHVMTMRALSREEIVRYVKTHRPLDSAGAYRIEDAGIKLFSRIEGQDYTGIIGLPLLTVAKLLRDIGLLPADRDHVPGV